MLAKMVTLGIIAAIGDDKDRNRYRLEHLLVKANSLGGWNKALENATSRYLLTEAYTEQNELNKKCKVGEWQYDSVIALKAALDELGIESETIPVKSEIRRWFRLFTTLRNKTRGHVAIQSTMAGRAVEYLAKRINLFYSNFSLFNRQ